MGTCPQCGAQVAAGNRFCTQCGAVQPVPNHDLFKRPSADRPPAPPAPPSPPPPPALPVELTRGVREREPEWDAEADPYGYEPRPRRTGLIVAALVVVVAIAAAAAWLLSGLDSNKSGTATPAATQPSSAAPATSQQASSAPEKTALAGISRLLDDSAATRSVVGPAVSGVLACTLDPKVGAERLQQAADARASQLQRLQQVAGTSPDVVTVRGKLVTAWQASRGADLAFQRWAAGMTGACKRNSTGNADYRSGVSLSAQADAAKRAFVADWNTLAAANGLVSRTAGSI